MSYKSEMQFVGPSVFPAYHAASLKPESWVLFHTLFYHLWTYL